MGTNFTPLPENPWQGFSFPGQAIIATPPNGQTEFYSIRPGDRTSITTEFLEAFSIHLWHENELGGAVYLDRKQAATLANSILLWLNEENKKDETHG